MRKLKYGLFILLAVSLGSCLKPKNDFGGIREDAGNVLTSITEKQYINTDNHVIGFGYLSFANFSFTQPAGTEQVKFFTLHISQPRENKLSGDLRVKISMSALSGYDAFPAGAVTIPAEVVVPASSANFFDFPVKFAVNKSLLDATKHYGATFTITSVSQGAYSNLDNSVDVIVNGDGLGVNNNSRYVGRYKWVSTITDPANQYTLVNDTKPIVFTEGVANSLDILDYYAFGLSSNGAYRYLWSNNNQTGLYTALFRPRYNVDASGKVTSITNMSNVAASASTTTVVLAPTAVTNVTLDASGGNQFTYTDNNTRTLSVKYSFDLTTPVNGVSTTRKVQVSETFTYDALQVYF